MVVIKKRNGDKLDDIKNIKVKMVMDLFISHKIAGSLCNGHDNDKKQK